MAKTMQLRGQWRNNQGKGTFNGNADQSSMKRSLLKSYNLTPP
jgi:hypothetical protein